MNRYLGLGCFVGALLEDHFVSGGGARAKDRLEISESARKMVILILLNGLLLWIDFRL